MDTLCTMATEKVRGTFFTKEACIYYFTGPGDEVYYYVAEFDEEGGFTTPLVLMPKDCVRVEKNALSASDKVETEIAKRLGVTPKTETST